ncbi:Immunity protein 50 [Rubritalea squalenifaciens DSM 18772]|uniref:Immunity protein 50 n=1 Tax=Rubritalea squalenifaciens DSM 18772 TaxID=1123071 RepID=A0A1M6QJA5_9BACT|nr:Imm50 family immunity protein [Rubritalea squalenifaciens]SHK20321.1 Immunity protein 50 [Rubritalea squalenifaciens DSM 18772]
MPETPPLKNVHQVTEAFGYFPVFHDAEVISLSCHRGAPDTGSPSIDFTLHAWEMTSELTESGHYQLGKHHLITFRFHGVDHVKLDHWNYQNVLFELIIREIEEPSDHALLTVDFSSSFGLEGGFRAISGEIISVTPCDEDGVALK